jgi:predicted extracellular nuclease
VRAGGTVTEFNGLTELSNVTTVTIGSSGNPLPASTAVSLPVTNVTDFEVTEGMRVTLTQSLVISEYFNYERFGELVLGLPLAGESRPYTGTAIDEPGAPALARAQANSLRRVTLDDGLSTQSPNTLRHPNGGNFALNNRFRGGDTVQNVTGVMDYQVGLYRIQPTGPADYTAVNPRIAAPEPVGGDLRVAAMNTLNFFLTQDYPTGNPLDNKCGPAQNVECRGADFDQPTEFTRQRDKLLAALAGLNADVIGLNELENTTGVDPLADATNGIVPGLAALGAGTYASIDTGTIGVDAIRVGLIYKPAKVTPVGAFQILESSDDPRFIDTKSRPALAQTFEENATGARFTVVVNHLKSKGSACDDVGDPDIGDGQGNCNQTRKAAAQALVDWLATDPTGSGDADFLIMGDLNSYTQEDPIDAIKLGADDTAGTTDDFTNLVAKYGGTYAYSYVFDGQAGYLDHALASPTLTAQVTGATEWHINADEPDLLDYDTSFKPPAQEAIYEPNAYRSSDHDAVVVGLDLRSWSFTGFFQPVDNPPAFNIVNAGQGIPVKFSLGGNQGLGIFASGFPTSQVIGCDGSAPTDTVETTTSGKSGLSYDRNTDTYTYVWKTNKAWANTCRQFVLILKGGTNRVAYFQLN